MVGTEGLLVMAFGLLLLFIVIILYRRFAKRPDLKDAPEVAAEPDMSLNKKRKRRLRVASKTPEHSREDQRKRP